VLFSPPLREDPLPVALLPNPREMEESGPMAVLLLPPLTEEAEILGSVISPLAVLPIPPLTDDANALAVLPKPPAD
jgi:hypothetical protein